MELIRDLVPINTLFYFGPDWMRSVVSIMLTRFKTAIFNNSRANNFRVTGRILLIIKIDRDLVPINILCKFGPDWLRNVVSIVLTRSKTAIFNLSGPITRVTGRILLIIKFIRSLVAINTSCKFGPDWLRNVVSIARTRKEFTDACTVDELPWHKPLWPLASGAKK